MRARGVNGGWGRAERPVPPIMAMGTGSRFFVSVCWELWDRELAWVCFGKVVHFGNGPEASEGVRELDIDGGRRGEVFGKFVRRQMVLVVRSTCATALVRKT